MAVPEEINRRVLELPEPMRTEVLHFVDYLLARTRQEDPNGETQEWLDLSLRAAMRGMEDEEGPNYSEADLTERFR